MITIIIMMMIIIIAIIIYIYIYVYYIFIFYLGLQFVMGKKTACPGRSRSSFAAQQRQLSSWRHWFYLVVRQTQYKGSL